VGDGVLPADQKHSKEFPDSYMAICAVARDQSEDIRSGWSITGNSAPHSMLLWLLPPHEGLGGGLA
jgi:hypothetical protein